MWTDKRLINVDNRKDAEYMFYPEELIEEIRSKNDIVDIISGYVKIQKRGADFQGLCPFHNEKSPSFHVSPTKQVYHCFGCGAGGNVFTFLMNYENYTFKEAIEVMAKRAGIDLPEMEFSEEARREADQKTLILEVNKEAARYFYYQLRMKQGKIGYDYLINRGLSEETIKKFGLGYANKTSNDLVMYLKSKGYREEQIVKAGLATTSEKYGIQDKFWNRVIFPILDINHRAIGFGGRVMGEGNPKYLNSPETIIFDKGRNLYGLNLARTSRKNNIILCEGYMDVISLHQSGFSQAVASLGTAFTSGQATLLGRYTENVYLAYDSDAAGVKAALRALTILREAGLTGKVINLEPFKDPDELIKTEGADGFEKRIEKAENSFLFEIRMLEKDYDLTDPEMKTKFYRETAGRLCRFSQEVERENYLEAVATRYNISFEHMRELIQIHASKTGLAAPVKRVKSGIQSEKSLGDSIRKNQRLLITWLAEEPHLYDKVKEFLTPEDFTEQIYREVAVKLFEGFKNGSFSIGSFVSMFSEEEQQRKVAELFNTKMDMLNTKQEREKAFHDVLIKVKENSLQYYSNNRKDDPGITDRVIREKITLEKLKNMHISL